MSDCKHKDKVLKRLERDTNCLIRKIYKCDECRSNLIEEDYTDVPLGPLEKNWYTLGRDIWRRTAEEILREFKMYNSFRWAA